MAVQLTSPSDPTTKYLVIDGIGGVPLGRELVEAIEAEGHSAMYFDCLRQSVSPLYGLRSACAKVINRRSEQEFYHLPRLFLGSLSQLLESERPTHVLVVGFIYKFFDPAELRRLTHRIGASLLLYDTDSCNLYGKRREFIFFIEKELPVYDRIFSFSQVTTRFFVETRRLPATHLPFGAAPISLPECIEPKIDTLFVGSGDLRRIFLLEAIRDHVTVLGNRWRRHRPLISAELQRRISDQPVWGDELHRWLARSKIVLNITRGDFYAAETGVNLRIFEALAAGCFLLTDHCDEIGNLFDIGVEIDTFHSRRELTDKVRYYLQNETQRNAIAERGHARFLADHTWRHRVRQLPGLAKAASESLQQPAV